jgi:AraC family transcriptional regulator
MNLSHRIEISPEIRIIGLSTQMSLVENKTRQLWQEFMPHRAAILGKVNDTLFSIEVYSEDFFNKFDPKKPFEKWAGIEIHQTQEKPSFFKELVIPTGIYVVFNYKGKGSKVGQTYEYIINTWLPQSGYKLANRPHFAKMGSKYKNEDDNSQEELWVPIKSS